MVLSRVTGLLVMVTALALLVTHLRGETVRANHRANLAHLKALAVRRELWDSQVELARLRSPQEIRRRVESMKLAVIPQPVELPLGNKPVSTTRLASTRLNRPVDVPVQPKKKKGRGTRDE